VLLFDNIAVKAGDVKFGIQFRFIRRPSDLKNNAYGNINRGVWSDQNLLGPDPYLFLLLLKLVISNLMHS